MITRYNGLKFLLTLSLLFFQSGGDWAFGLVENKLTAGGDAASQSYFGRSVSISGSTVVVGAPGVGDARDRSGSAYVFRYTDMGWVEEDRLTASDAAAEDAFGTSVSVSGDTVVVGAVWDDDGGDKSGSAYVFRHTSTGWVEEDKLTASDAAAYDYFGTSVSVSGDIAVVGASGNDDQIDSSGSAYVFRYNGTDWIEEDKLTASDAARQDFFGTSVALSGSTVVVGASHDDDVADNSGSAYIFRYTGTDWIEEDKLTASDAAVENKFGSSVAIADNTVAVGAYGDDAAGNNSGSAYIFRYTGTDWVEEDKLTASDASAYDWFGYSVTIADNAVVVGALLKDNTDDELGSAYLFRFNGTNWAEVAKLTAADTVSFDHFGSSVSVSGNTAVVGAPNNDDAGSNSGSAYVFRNLPHPSGTMSSIPLLLLDDTALAAPTNLQATTLFRTNIALNWSYQSAKIDGFRIYRGTTGTNINTLIATLDPSEDRYVDAGLDPFSIYFYHVNAYQSNQESSPSNTAEGRTLTDFVGQFDLQLAISDAGPCPDCNSVYSVIIERQGMYGINVLIAGVPMSGLMISNEQFYIFGNLPCYNYFINIYPVLTIAPDGNSMAGTTGTYSGSWNGQTCVGSVAAVFTRASHALSVDKSGDGSGNVYSEPFGISCGDDCSEEFLDGTQVTLTAIPNGDSHLARWSGCNTADDRICIVTMDQDKTVTATFALGSPQSFNLSVEKDGTGSGTVTGNGIDCGVDCEESYPSQTLVTLSATPDTGSFFAGWSGCDLTPRGQCWITMDQAKSVRATFNISTSP